MEKQDILVVALAVVAFAVLVLAVLPFLAGQHFGTATGGTIPEGGSGPLVTTPLPTTPGASATPPEKGRPVTPSPTETQPWDGSVKNIGFVGQPDGQVTPSPNPPIPQPAVQNRSLITYAKISNQWPGTTENLYIPAPWWVLEYTADPLALPPNAYPLLLVQVFDAQNPNRFVIAPIRQTIYEEPPDTPWSVKLYEGKRTYYFRVDTLFIKSYTLTIKVPQEFVST
ncbi:MAG: hypothetical protein LUQ32_03620 [Methanomicrobiales archaeon]|nr:hypothetical protein [Methanomicrobiales archaeon]